MARFLIYTILIFGFRNSARAIEFKDCTKLKSACFDIKSSPEKAFVIRAQTSRAKIDRKTASVAKPKVAVLVHGLTDSAYSFKDLSLFLNEQGYTVYGVLLKGHGTVPDDLLTVNNTDWLRDVWETMKLALRETHAPKALLVGFSLGGVLVSEVAEQKQWKNKISGLILMVPAYQIKSKLAQVACDSGFAEYIQTWAERKPGSTAVEYNDMTMHSVCELVALSDRVRKNIKNIDVPVYITLTDYDHDLNNVKTLDVIAQMQSQAKEVFYLRKSYADLEIPGIEFMQVVVPRVRHDAVTYESDPIHHRKNPAYSQMIDDIKNFMRKNNI